MDIKANKMKALLIIIAPAVLLIVTFAIIGVEWYYYLIGLVVGDGIGALILLTLIQIGCERKIGKK